MFCLVSHGRLAYTKKETAVAAMLCCAHEHLLAAQCARIACSLPSLLVSLSSPTGVLLSLLCLCSVSHTYPPPPQEVSSLSLRCSPLSYCLDIESCHGLIYSGCHHHGHPRRQSLLLRRLHLHHRMQTARNGARHAAAAAAEHLLPVHTSARD
jgi:hypothetical protein